MAYLQCRCHHTEAREISARRLRPLPATGDKETRRHGSFPGHRRRLCPGTSRETGRSCRVRFSAASEYQVPDTPAQTRPSYMANNNSTMSESSPGSCNECNTAPGGCRPLDQAGAHTWNDLPVDVTSAPSLLTLRKRLKLHLFRLSYPGLVI